MYSERAQGLSVATVSISRSKREETSHVKLASNFACLSPDTQIKLDPLFLFNSHYKVSAMGPRC